MKNKHEEEKKTESNEYSKIIKKKTEKGFLISKAALRTHLSNRREVTITDFEKKSTLHVY